MTNTIQQAVLPLIQEEDGDADLLNYLDLVEEAIVIPDDGLEAVRVQRDMQGHVVVATTQKLPNLRFRLKDLLVEAASTGTGMAAALDKPVVLVLSGIRFLKTLRKLSTLDVHKEDAEMLIAIYRLEQEERRVRVDDLPALLPGEWNDRQVARSLERLELLACIEVGMDGITLNETILVKGLD